jgi:hypothetical protein
MIAPEPLAPPPDEQPPQRGPSLVPPLTKSQQQILRLLHNGDLLWEIADDPAHYTIYNEKRGRDQCVRATLVTTLAEQGWIRQWPNPQADRLDSWEITPEGRALLPTPKRRRRTVEPASGIPPSG